MTQATHPYVSIVVPSWTGDVARLCASLETQTYQNFELVVIQGVSPAGRARNEGVAQAQGEIIVFVDDDAYLGHEHVLETLITTLDTDPTIGVTGTSKLIPLNASALQQRIAAEVPRWIYPVVDEDTESNPPLNQYGYTGITTTCCAIRKSTFQAVNGFDVQLATGEDTEFFFRIRRIGLRFVIPKQCWVYHDPPKRLGDLLRKSFQYGIGHAQEMLKNPERGMEIIPLSRWYSPLIVLMMPFLFVPLLFMHLYFDPVRRWRFGFLPLKMLSTYATLSGYMFRWYARRYKAVQPVAASADHAPAQAQQQSASRSSTISGITFFSVALLNNIYAIVMAHLLPVHEYGMLGLVQSWLLIAATLLNSGFSWELARVLARGSTQQEAHGAAKSALIGNLVVSLVFSCGLIAILSTNNMSLGANTSLILGMLLLETLLFGLAAVWGGVLQGMLQFGPLGIGRFVESFVKLVGGIGLVLLGLRTEGAIAAMVVGTLAYVALLAWSARHFTFWRTAGWGDWHMFTRSLTIFVGLCALTMMSNLDIIGVKFFSPPQTADLLTGYYQIPALLSRIPVLLAGAYAAALFPYISRASKDELSIYVVRGMKYALILIVPLNLLLIAAPEAAIRFMFPEVYTAGAMALRLSACASLLLVLTTMLTTILQARGLAHLPAWLLPAAVVCEAAALWYFVPQYGIVGASIALLIASAFAAISLAIVSARQYPWQLSSRQCLSYLLSCIALVMLMAALPHESRLWTAASGVLAVAVYAMLLSLTGLLRPKDLTDLTAGVPLGDSGTLQSIRTRSLQFVRFLNGLLPQGEVG